MRGSAPVLITGGSGQVGHDLRALLVRRGIGYVAPAHADMDIADPDAVDATVARVRPGWVVNLAAYTAVDRAESDREAAQRINRDGPAHLAAACAAAGIPLLHVSTDYVFDGNKGAPYVEDDVACPINWYGETKWQGEEAIRAALGEHLILRTSWVFGAHGHNFVRTMLRLAAERDELGVVADQSGCPTPARDIAATLATLIERGTRDAGLPWGTYHFAGAPVATWHDLACAALDAAGSTVPVRALTTADYPTPARRPRNTALDGGKLRAVFGIGPADWRAAVRAVVATIPSPSAAPSPPTH